jgi:hypothetical protein
VLGIVAVVERLMPKIVECVVLELEQRARERAGPPEPAPSEEPAHGAE